MTPSPIDQKWGIMEESELEMLMVTYKDSCKPTHFHYMGKFSKKIVKCYGLKLFRIH